MRDACEDRSARSRAAQGAHVAKRQSVSAAACSVVHAQPEPLLHVFSLGMQESPHGLLSVHSLQQDGPEPSKHAVVAKANRIGASGRTRDIAQA